MAPCSLTPPFPKSWLQTTQQNEQQQQKYATCALRTVLLTSAVPADRWEKSSFQGAAPPSLICLRGGGDFTQATPLFGEPRGQDADFEGPLSNLLRPFLRKSL